MYACSLISRRDEELPGYILHGLQNPIVVYLTPQVVKKCAPLLLHITIHLSYSNYLTAVPTQQLATLGMALLC